jgi:hypothetical protein
LRSQATPCEAKARRLATAVYFFEVFFRGRFFADTFFVDFFELDFFVDFDGLDRFVDFFAVDFRDEDFFAVVFLVLFLAPAFLVDFFAEDFFVDFLAPDFRFGFGGALSPSRRASDNAIAMACLRLVTFLCEPPLRSLPSFFSCITLRTLSCVFLPYFAIGSSWSPRSAGCRQALPS